MNDRPDRQWFLGESAPRPGAAPGRAPGKPPDQAPNGGTRRGGSAQRAAECAGRESALRQQPPPGPLEDLEDPPAPAAEDRGNGGLALSQLLVESIEEAVALLER